MAMFYLTIVFVFLGKFFSFEFIWSIHVYLQYCEILQLFSYFNMSFMSVIKAVFSASLLQSSEIIIIFWFIINIKTVMLLHVFFLTGDFFRWFFDE